MTHPFEDTPQYEQVYGNQHGPPIGRTGNGLGDVWGGTGNPESITLRRRPRPNNSPPEDLYSTPLEDDGNDERGLDEEEINLLHESIGRLTARQAFVLRLRYGLTDGVEYTLEEIGSLMGVTHQAVSDIEQRALVTLQKLVAGG